MIRAPETFSPLGQHIRAYRKANRYSLQQLGDEMGISKAQLWAIESDPNPNPRLNTLIAVAKATKTTLARIATLAAMSHKDAA
jgi:transcriptional regulator with XRE-family HTH domain